MPSPEAAMAALLNQATSPPMTAVVGNRIHVDALPQDVVWPAIRYQRISTDRADFRDLATGRSGYAQVRMQVDVFSTTRAQALSISQAIVAALEGFQGAAGGAQIDEAWIEDEAGDLEPDIGPAGAAIYRQRLDVMLVGPFAN